jgi:hypothetical protein
MPFNPNCLATAIGSMPHADTADAAVQIQTISDGWPRSSSNKTPIVG